MAYPFELPDLGYDLDALEPHIDARTMGIHHGKHHAAYTANLNAALAQHPELHAKPADELVAGLDALPESIRGAVRNNGGGYLNHTLFWDVMTPGGSSSPSGALAAAIGDAFGDLEGFKRELHTAAMTRFGSGWGWLCVQAGGGLCVCSTPNQDTPLMTGSAPLLGIDVWEHAYYLNYQNRRPDYINAWWNVVNWDRVAARFKAANP